MTHTPGPWHTTTRRWGFVCATTCDEKVVIVANCRGGDSEKIVTNARLIAAAPDLLEACRAMVQCCPTVGRDDSTHGNAWRYAAQAIQSAKQAIAKAEGRAS